MSRIRTRALVRCAVVAVIAIAGACTNQAESPSASGFRAPATSTPTTKPAAVPTTTPITLPAPPAGTTWRRVFDDEFDEKTLDTNVWATCYPWATTTCTNLASGENELYTPANVSAVANELLLIAREQRITSELGTFPYTSGLVSTQRPGQTTFSFRYGYVQARVWLPAGSGLWSAFWLLDAQGEVAPEIDIAESLGRRADRVDEFVHWSDAAGQHQFGNAVALPGALTGWHVYAVDWEPASITWYIDGHAEWKMTYKVAVPQVDMIIIANLAVGGYYALLPPPSTHFPKVMQVDYIRVWQHS